MKLEDLRDKKLAIVGMGVNNRSLAEYFRRHKIAFEIIDDWKAVEELTPQLSGFDIIFRTPGLPYLSVPIQNAKQRGAVIYSQTKLFFDLCPAKIIGVTGTKGKGTTATLIYKILEAAPRQARGDVYIAGNIGQDPFEFLDQIRPNDLVVLELSSFQLQDLHKSPHIAVVLKTFSEHLDHHQTVAEYWQAKSQIVSHQNADDFAVLNYDSEIVRGFAKKTKARIYWASTEQVVTPGSHIKNDKVFFNFSVPSPGDLPARASQWQAGGEGKGEVEIMSTQEVGLIGRFNLQNVTAAITAAITAGARDFNIIKKVVSEFKGLEHRLEFVRELGGVRFYNDSFSTTPESTAAAISVFNSNLVLIVGGSEKQANYEQLARALASSRVRVIIPIGITGPKIAALARQAGYAGRISEKIFSNMGEIVAQTNALAEAGDVVLLSPAAASFGLFKDYKHRGELFKKYVGKL